MSGDDSRPSLRAPAQETVFRPSPLVSPSGPLYIERMFLLRLCINQSIHHLHLYRSLYSNTVHSKPRDFPPRHRQWLQRPAHRQITRYFTHPRR